MAYATPKTIAALFKLIVGKTIYHVKNMAQFSKQLKDSRLKEDDIMNSHDVVSLFTSVLINKAMVVIWNQLEGDKTLKGRMNLTSNEVMCLLEFVILMIYLQFDGEFYQ